jgi:hypothetical protein
MPISAMDGLVSCNVRLFEIISAGFAGKVRPEKIFGNFM